MQLHEHLRPSEILVLGMVKDGNMHRLVGYIITPHSTILYRSPTFKLTPFVTDQSDMRVTTRHEGIIQSVSAVFGYKYKLYCMY
jgi:hypothetical protein